MVDQTSNLKVVEQELLKLFFNNIQNRDKIPIIREDENGNIIMRASFEGNTGMTLISEVKAVYDLLPEDFQGFIENWGEIAPQLSPQIASITLLPEKDGYGTAKSIANAPYPISNRVTFTARYPQLNFKPNEHVFVVSSKGLDEYKNIHLSDKERKDFVIATVFIGGWWFQPIMKNDEIIGTHIFNVQCADAGGSIPSALSNKIGPGQALATIHNLRKILLARKRKNQGQNIIKTLNDDPSQLKSLFDQAVTSFKANSDQLKKDSVLKEDIENQLLALQQQGTVGDCNVAKPGGFFNGSAKSQWEAWNSLKGMTKEQAQTKFVQVYRII